MEKHREMRLGLIQIFYFGFAYSTKLFFNEHFKHVCRSISIVYCVYCQLYDHVDSELPFHWKILPIMQQQQLQLLNYLIHEQL